MYHLKNMKNNHGGVLLLAKLLAQACNFTLLRATLLYGCFSHTLTLNDGGPYHIEISFYMIGTSVMKELNCANSDKSRKALHMVSNSFGRSTCLTWMIMSYSNMNLKLLTF